MLESYLIQRDYTPTPVDNSLVINIVDSDNKDVTDNYIIVYKYGKVSVSQRIVYVTTPTTEFMYNGKPQSSTAWSYTEITDANIEHDLFVDFHTFDVINYSAITNVSENTKINSFDIIVFDGDDDVSHNYDIRYTNGTIKVKKRPILVITDTEEWTYDANEHSAGYHLYIDNTKYFDFAEGQRGLIIDAPTVFEVAEGKVENYFNISIVDSDDNKIDPSN